MSIDVNGSVSDADLEQRLRSMYSAVVPLLDEDPEPGPVSAGIRPSRHSRQHGRRRVGVAAALLLVVGLVAVQRVSVNDRAQHAVDSTLPEIGSAVPEQDTLPALTSVPLWYDPLRSPLPAGFDQLSLVQTNELSVGYLAFRTTSTQVLEIRIGLDPTFGGGVPIDPITFTDDAGDYSEVEGMVRMRTTDDRTITVRCGLTPTTIGSATALSAATVSSCADPSQTDPIDAAGLRQIARQLVSVPTEPLATPTVTPLSAELRRRSERDLPTLFGVETTAVDDGYSSAVRVMGIDSDNDFAAPSTVITMLSNMYGPADLAEPTSDDDSSAEFRNQLAGISTLLVVSDHGAIHVATTEPIDEMAARIHQLLNGPDLPKPVATPDQLVIVGDEFSEALSDALADQGWSIDERIIPSSGLSRPDFFNWPNMLPALLDELPVGVPVVISFGGNDYQGLKGPDGSSVAEPDDPDWDEQYTNRIRDFMTEFTDAGHPVIWIGVNHPGRPESTQPGSISIVDRMATIRLLTMDVAASVPDVTYIDTWTVLSSPDGSPDPDTQATDQYHLSPAGAAHLAETVNSAVAATATGDPSDHGAAGDD